LLFIEDTGNHCYKIEGITPGDDYAAMRQVLQRRYRALAQPVESDEEAGDSSGGKDAKMGQYACPTWC
jgi:excinuclease ABC subunit C